jgi:hypothetical protein
MDNFKDYAEIVLEIIGGLAIIIKATPTKKDDAFFNKYIKKPVDILCKTVFFWTK